MHTCRSVLQKEAETLYHASKNLNYAVLDDVITELLEHIERNGRIAITGVGKNYSIAHKMAATYNSLGIPAYHLDPNHALHGDLGALQPNDCLVLLSKSGDTRELIELMDHVDNSSISICCAEFCALNRRTKLHLALPFAGEADHLGLAPTASSTLLLAVGDAIGVTLSKELGWTRRDFLSVHPAGTLGKVRA